MRYAYQVVGKVPCSLSLLTSLYSGGQNSIFVPAATSGGDSSTPIEVAHTSPAAETSTDAHGYRAATSGGGRQAPVTSLEATPTTDDDVIDKFDNEFSLSDEESWVTVNTL